MADRSSNLEGVLALLRESADERAMGAAEYIKDYLVAQMSAAKSGRTYRVPGTGQTYTAAAAGEYPAERTGDLVRSLQVAPGPDGSAVVGSDDPVAGAIEKVRPWLSRAEVELEAQLRRQMETGW